MSRNAIVRGLLDTMVAGMWPAAIPQNKQSGTPTILTCTGPATPLTYMVALLRTHGAPPLWCHGLARFWLPLLRGELCAGAAAKHEWAWGDVEVASRAGLLTEHRKDP